MYENEAQEERGICRNGKVGNGREQRRREGANGE